VLAALGWIGRHGQWMLVAGLAAGIAFPAAAKSLREWLMPLIGVILFLSMLRVTPAQAAKALSHARREVPLILALQLAMPLMIAAFFHLVGIKGALAEVLILMAAAAPMASGAGIAVLTGVDALTALRLLLWGTLLLPLTSIVPLQIVFADQSLSVAGPVLRLLAIIAAAGGAAMLARVFLWPTLEGRRLKALDGFAALFLAAFVVSLMDAIQPMLLDRPGQVAMLLAAAFLASFGLQFGVDIVLRPLLARSGRDVRGAVALMAGSRNLGLFLAALPPASMDAMMVFVGCYQVPVFLTPLLMRRYYTRGSAAVRDDAPARIEAPPDGRAPDRPCC
jgi:ACR3 family arsenite transporter